MDAIDAYFYGFTATLIHGAPASFDLNSNAISEGFRNSVFSLSPGFGWIDASYDSKIMSVASGMEAEMRRFGYNSYLNEENENCNDCNWKQLFWGVEKYNKLLHIKQYWDPNNVFWCPHCVGSDT